MVGGTNQLGLPTSWAQVARTDTMGVLARLCIVLLSGLRRDCVPRDAVVAERACPCTLSVQYAWDRVQITSSHPSGHACEEEPQVAVHRGVLARHGIAKCSQYGAPTAGILGAVWLAPVVTAGTRRTREKLQCKSVHARGNMKD